MEKTKDCTTKQTKATGVLYAGTEKLSNTRRNKMNSVKCLQCGKILTSTYRHDFQMCDCENQTFIAE
jgi:hypothetical protein